MSKHFTKKQHYIPRMILKHHTYFRVPMSKPIIYQFDKDKTCCRSVDVNDICRQKNLYEFRNADGTINEALRNSIEKAFSFYESHWDNSINKIIEHKKLSKRDYALLYLLVALQILRLPKIQEVEAQYCKEQMKNSGQHFTAIEVENMIKLISFPIGQIGDKQALLMFFLGILCKKEIIIRFTDDTLVINGDIPITVNSANFDCNFPITPHICTQLREKRHCKDYTCLSRNEVRCLNYHMITDNGRFVYSSIPFEQVLQ